MRADRLLSLLLLLQNRGRMTAGALATELEVSVRTVYRDVEALLASGVPVVTDRGPAGGYRLVDGYRTRLTGLSDAEAGTLPFVGIPGPAGDLGLGAELATAQLKLQAALPTGLAERARRVQERFHLDASAWFRDTDPVPHLATIAAAVWEQRVLRVRYQRWRGEVDRDLHPLGLVLKSGIWYLAALTAPAGSPPPPDQPPGTSADHGPAAGPAAASPDAVRTYRVARFRLVDPLEEVFQRPAGFNLAGYWAGTSRRLTAALHQQTAQLRVSPEAQRLLPVQFGAAGSRALEDAGPPDPDGWVRVELAVEAEPVAVGDLLRLGTGAEVLGPPALRRAVAEAVAVLAERYTPVR